MTQQLVARSSLLTLILLAAMMSLATIGFAGDSGHHEGTFINAGIGKITILNRDQTMNRTFPMSDLVTVTRNGRPANLRELVRGDLVQVTTDLVLKTEIVVAVAAVTRE